ncbi:MAG: isoaspartyl peptidase/L-asparaginase [Pirellula sp.]
MMQLFHFPERNPWRGRVVWQLAIAFAWLLGPGFAFSFQSNVPDGTNTTNRSETLVQSKPNPNWSIAIHGGAGGDLDRWSETQRKMRIDGLKAALRKGKELLENSMPAIDVVQAVVQVLEDDPNFNAGRGAVLNNVGGVSLDASIMDGADLSCGAVANVSTVRNPIQLARAVRDKTPHVFLCGEAADVFAKELGLPLEAQEYFKTEEQIESWKQWKAKQAAKGAATSKRDHDLGEDRLFYLGTVGCVVRDQTGNLAAATSTGGLLGKRYGRVGDSPIIGAGTYAKNNTCAISCTGVGELYIRNHIASAVSARMEYLRESLEAASKFAIHTTLPEDSGGLIAVDKDGNIELQFNTPIMARGQAKSDGTFRVGLKDWVE